MRLSWNEIRARAARFAGEWKNAHYEKGESQTFYNEFFEVFGVTRRRVASFEEPVKKLGDQRGFIDLFWKGVLLVEQNANLALEISSYAYVLETGRVTMEGKSSELRANPQLKSAYLGG